MFLKTAIIAINLTAITVTLLNMQDKTNTESGAVLVETAVALLVLLSILTGLIALASYNMDISKMQHAITPAVRILSSDRNVCYTYNSTTNPCQGTDANDLMADAEDWIDFVLNQGKVYADPSTSPARINYFLMVDVTEATVAGKPQYYFTIAIKDIRPKSYSVSSLFSGIMTATTSLSVPIVFADLELGGTTLPSPDYIKHQVRTYVHP